MARQLVRKTPFTSGYSEQARVDVDFGDFDNFEVGEMPGNAAELEQIRRAASPLYREDLRFKNPKKLSKEVIKEQMDSDPTNKLPTQESDYDAVIDAWLNGFDPYILKSEGIESNDFGQGFIDDAENTYHNAPSGYQLPVEHHPYIKQKVNELIESKYPYLKPFHKVG